MASGVRSAAANKMPKIVVGFGIIWFQLQRLLVMLHCVERAA